MSEVLALLLELLLGLWLRLLLLQLCSCRTATDAAPAAQASAAASSDRDFTPRLLSLHLSPHSTLPPLPRLLSCLASRHASPSSALSAFNEWEALLRERQMLARALHLAINMGMGRGFRRWSECADERQRLRAVAERVMRRMLKRALAASFDGW